MHRSPEPVDIDRRPLLLLGLAGVCTFGLGPGDRVLGGEATRGEIIHLPGKGGEPCHTAFWPAPPDLCPTSNTKTRQPIEQMLTQLEAAQQRHNVSVRSGHVLGMSHRLVVFTEAPRVEATTSHARRISASGERDPRIRHSDDSIDMRFISANRKGGLMKPHMLLPALAILVVCSVAWPAIAQPPVARNFIAHLSGDEEVPPVATLAQGQAIFHLNKDDTALSYQLIVANIENVSVAHIHCGAEGVNGPVVVFLFGPATPAVTVNGILAEGTITEDDIIARPDSVQCPGGVADFDELLAKMRSGDAYVNVHTTAHPGGEIRGQIDVAGP